VATDDARARIAGAAAVGVTIAAVIAWSALRDGAAAARACDGGPLGGTWPGARVAVTRGLEVEPTTRDGTIAAMDRYAEKWRGRWRAACDAGPRDAPAFREVAACLLDGREEAAALTAELARPSAALLGGAIAAVEALPDPTQCVPGAVAALPDDPADRGRARAIALELARIRGLTRSRPGPAAEAAARAVEVARALGHAPTIAAALYVLGAARLQLPDVAGARATLSEAILAAEEVADDELRARALIDLATLEIAYSQDTDAARRAARQATAAAEHARDPRLRAALLEGLAELAVRDGDLTTAIARLAEAAALDDASGVLLASTRVRRRQAELMRTAGRRTEALALLDGQLAVVEAELGRLDATTVALMIDTAGVLMWLGRYDEAHALVVDAADRRPPTPPPDGAQLITARVVDATGSPVPDADVVIAPYELHGDGAYLMQPNDPTSLAESGVHTLRADADGEVLAALDPGAYFVIAEHDDLGRAAPRWIQVRGDDQVTLTLAPWAAIDGTVSGALTPDAHLHLIPVDGAAYRLEVPIVDGGYRARAPAGRHRVQVSRSDHLPRDVRETIEVTLRPDAVTTTDL